MITRDRLREYAELALLDLIWLLVAADLALFVILVERWLS